MSEVVLLYGGGLDSTALLIELATKHYVRALHINYGQIAYAREQIAGIHFCNAYRAKYETFNMDLKACAPHASIMGGNGGDMMDGRNLVLISAAAMYASARGISYVYLGFHKEPADHPFPDATEAALHYAQQALDVMLAKTVILAAPFIHMSRFEIVKKGVYADDTFLERTHTCYDDIFGGCGKCKHCVEKADFEKRIAAGE